MFLVSFKRFCIVLPSLESESEFYSSLSLYWERGQRITFQANIWENWPDKLQMKLVPYRPKPVIKNKKIFEQVCKYVSNAVFEAF
jgi:hypothetical protein